METVTKKAAPQLGTQETATFKTNRDKVNELFENQEFGEIYMDELKRLFSGTCRDDLHLIQDELIPEIIGHDGFGGSKSKIIGTITQLYYFALTLHTFATDYGWKEEDRI